VEIVAIVMFSAAALFLFLYVRARTELAAATARLDAERAAAGEKLAIVERARGELRDTFAALSAEALRSNNESFLLLAKTELESKRGAIEQIVEPLKQSLTKVDSQLQQVERERSGAQGRLDAQLRSLGETHQSLQLETNKLVRALRSPNQRGRWGEIQLRNILERAGMTEYCGDFVEKEAAEDEQGRRAVPDMTVRLPNGSCIVIDSKVPIDAYLRALEETDDAKKEALLTEHARQLRAHVKGLSAKTYWAKFSPTPELVVMFVPGEPLLSAALSVDPTLFDFAADQRVIPSSPLTLLALLRTVASSWQHQRLAESAEQVRALGSELYERLALLADHVQDVGQNLKQAGAAYDRFVGSLESRVLVTARRFRELGVSAARELADVEPVHIDVREPRAAELRAPVQARLLDGEVVHAEIVEGVETT
jgi:DNA recombination protein RmuC